ncbi:MAG: hypothetical protein ACTHU0_30975 [Kofleriaceae bacterium]
MAGDSVHVELSHDQALVLFEWLSRFDESGDPAFVDPGEQAALWVLEGSLESKLSEQFRPNYLELVAQARERVRDTQRLPPSSGAFLGEAEASQLVGGIADARLRAFVERGLSTVLAGHEMSPAIVPKTAFDLRFFAEALRALGKHRVELLRLLAGDA